jgi:hypothetical protein
LAGSVHQKSRRIWTLTKLDRRKPSKQHPSIPPALGQLDVTLDALDRVFGYRRYVATLNEGTDLLPILAWDNWLPGGWPYALTGLPPGASVFPALPGAWVSRIVCAAIWPLQRYDCLEPNQGNLGSDYFASPPAGPAAEPPVASRGDLPPLRHRLRATVNAAHPASPCYPIFRQRCYGVSDSPKNVLLARVPTKRTGELHLSRTIWGTRTIGRGQDTRNITNCQRQLMPHG